MEGNCKIQLFDSKSGKEVFNTEKDNFIGVLAKRFIFSAGLSALGYYISNNDESKFGNFAAQNPFEKIVLTDNSTPVSLDAKVFPGNEISYADSEAYAGTDPLRGTINVNESYNDGEKLVLVFDFATDKANGTFQTVGFKYKGASPQAFEIAKSSYSYKCCCKNGDDIYFNVGSSIYKYNVATKQKTLVNTGFYSSAKGIAYYNGSLYFPYDTGSDDYIYSYDLSTGTVTTNIVKLVGDDNYGICFDGAYFYVFYDYSSTYRIYRYDTSWVLQGYKATTESWEYSQIANPGWFMRPDGTELNISDLFDNGIETTRKNYYVSSYGYQPVVEGGKVYKNGIRYVFYPSIWESSDDVGLAEGGNMGFRDIFGIDEGLWNLGTCILLDEPVTKNDTQTMKITYIFNIILP